MRGKRWDRIYWTVSFPEYDEAQYTEFCYMHAASDASMWHVK